MKEIETSLLEYEKFSFFCEERRERRKNIKWQQKTKKFKNFALFALFLLFGGRRRPKHLQMGHFHTHRYHKFL